MRCGVRYAVCVVLAGLAVLAAGGPDPSAAQARLTAPAGLIVNTEEFSGQNHVSPHICLTRAIYFEARSEPRAGQHAVGQVILNRVDHRYHPDTVCEVVYKNAHRPNRCQFSFACDGRRERVREPEAYANAARVARDLLACDAACRDQQRRWGGVPTSTHFHTTDVVPHWADKLIRTGRIGRHIFYYTGAL